MQTLADRMAEGLDITFGCIATKVAWGDHGVSVSCEDGRTFAADTLIVTVSLGVLKVMFVPWANHKYLVMHHDICTRDRPPVCSPAFPPGLQYSRNQAQCDACWEPSP